MRRIILYCLLALCSVHFSFAQDATPKAKKQLGIRLNKERFGTGLSGVLDIPIHSNGKVFLHQSIGITLAHPDYDIIDRNYISWKDTYPGPGKLFTTQLNYPFAGNYHLGIKWQSNTRNKFAFYFVANNTLYLGEHARMFDSNNFYIKELYYAVSFVTNYGCLFRINNNTKLGFDLGFGTRVNIQDEPIFWYNAGFNVLWNWK